MLAEEKYRAAIVALRDGQWEQAAKHLLELMTDAPGYRNVPQVLMTLEETRALAYWRAAFTFAIERGALEHAHSAIEKLGQLAPNMPDLPQFREIFQATQKAGWQPAHPPPPEPAAPPTETEPPSSWLMTDEFEQEMAMAMADLPTDNSPALNTEVAALQAEIPPITPADEQPARVLKSSLFPDSQLEMDISTGPVYNALEEPRALKSATFLDETIPHALEDTDRPLVSTYDTKPHALPERVAVEAPVQTDSDTHPIPTMPVETSALDEWPEAAVLAARQAGRRPPPSDVAPEDLIADELTALKEAVRARPRRRLDRLIIGSLGVLMVVILAAAVVMSGQSERGGLLDIFGGVQGNAPSGMTTSVDDMQALIRAIDTQLGRTAIPRSAETALTTLHSVMLDATEEASDLRQALSSWIDTGQEMLAAADEVNRLCIEGQTDSDSCKDARESLAALQTAASAAREQVCALLPTCPDH